MSDLRGAADSTKPAPHYRGHLTPEAPLIFGELWKSAFSTAPAILLIAGFGGVIDEPIREVARCFWRSGLTALVIDRPRFGLSGGEPRSELDPVLDIDSFSAALYWLTRDWEHPIGVWGTSFGAAESLLLAEADVRVKAVVAQAPPAPIVRHPMVQAELERTVAIDMKRRAEGLSPKSIPLVAQAPHAICAMPGLPAWNHLTKVASESWKNEITLRSLLLCSEVDCRKLLRRAKVPACVTGIRNDALALPEGDISVAKEVVLFEGEHYDLYDRHLLTAAAAAIAFFQRQLRE